MIRESEVDEFIKTWRNIIIDIRGNPTGFDKSGMLAIREDFRVKVKDYVGVSDYHDHELRNLEASLIIVLCEAHQRFNLLNKYDSMCPELG